ncbi:Variant-specific surface protein [Giardia duodenalis]|uniref:Variant-specific surface protein n=1 Tax=Giardia intestinalis TaxID=5741 RepID=V6TT56_GIAIN|nr:Variant-specific surface protein [Giardia intestinalis]
MPPPALARLPEEASAERPVHRSGDYCVQASMMQPRGSRARQPAEDFARDCLPYAASTVCWPPGTVYLQRVVHRTGGMLNRISVLLAICFAVGALAATCNGDQSSSCENAQCETLGTTQICIQCKNDGNVPINGVCKVRTDSEVVAAKCKKQDGDADLSAVKVCGQCGAGYFLHKGGCYKFGNEVAVLICNDAVAGDVEGVCSKCNTTGGFFKNPEAAATTDSCISCGDATGVTVGSNKYKGIADCTVCTAPERAGSGVTEKTATCTKCGNNKYLKVDGTACLDSANGCTANTEFGKADSSAGNKCISCGDETAGVAGCAECTAPTEPTNKPTCTKCSGDNYLKTVDGTTTCVTKGDCNGGYFPNDSVDSKKQCILCGTVANNGIDGCTECALLSSPSRAVLITCSACVSGKKPNTSGSQCIACDIDGCARCSEASKCSQCGDGYQLESDTCVSTGGGSNLSSGAIAGISVATVVVVGGLVGFLCWWFVCRGKA